jgi:hypothetical protein
MPIVPSTWNAGDFATASRLNGDLYSINGSAFLPTGTRWNAYRPVYSAWNSQNTTGTGGQWFEWTVPTLTYSGAIVTADTAAAYGSPIDPNSSGIISGNGPFGASGNVNATGGYYFLSAFMPMLNGGSNNIGAAIGTQGMATPQGRGTFQSPNASFDGCPMCLDIQDIAPGLLTAFMQEATSGSASSDFGHSSDGSGLSPRFQGFWASVLQNNGAILGAVPSPASSISTITAATMNATVRDVLNLFNMPPLLRCESTGTQAIADTFSPTTVNLASADYDTYIAQSGNSYVVPLNGLYLVHGLVSYASTTGGGEYGAGIAINGGDYWGPACTGNSGPITATKTQVFDLHAGDTIQLITYQATGATTQTIGGVAPSRLLVYYMGALGAPAISAVPPDVTFRWTAGNGGSPLTANVASLVNDMQFLLHRPYFMGYSSITQTGLTSSVASQLTHFNNVSGIVHSSTGDPYGGWSSGGQRYTAQVSGWYLCLQEIFMNVPSLTTAPLTIALFQPSPSGNAGWDNYQRLNCITSSGTFPGATALGLYYLRKGDSIIAGVNPFAQSSTTTQTGVSGGRQSHMEIVWISE